MFSLFSSLNRRSCCDWTLLSCSFSDDISEQFEQLLDPAILSNGVVEEKSIVVARRFSISRTDS
jgi:hypothetical protein